MDCNIIMSDKNKPLYQNFASSKLNGYSLPDDCAVTHGSRLSSTASSSDSVRLKPGFNRYDTDFHRPEDRIPTNHKDIIKACQGIYRKVGLIRNIIDLMSDFASEGLDLQHPNKKQERFYREWAKRVNLESRAHDFMRLMLRDANIIIRRKTAFITLPVIKEMTKADYNEPIWHVDETKVKEQLEKIIKDKKKVLKREIPWEYVFISPTMVDKIGGEVGRFFGSQSLAMRLSAQLISSIRNPKTNAEKEFVKKLPAEVINAAKKTGSNLIALDPNKIYVDYYKKDDWEDWGTPFLYGILEDILLKDKMKQADMAALDGVINTVRLWRLGNSDNKILPTPTAINKLLGILEHNVGGGLVDIVWDDMIDFKVEYPPTDKILGPEKYTSVDRDIIKGVGIPEALIGGTDTTVRNAQSAFVQLKTLVERLEYIRSKCIRWIENELKLVAEGMNFSKIPNVVFGTMSLRDEAAEKQLMIQLLDRNVISVETIHKVFGQDFAIELERLKTEQEIRSSDKPIFEKANPYYRPESIMEFQKNTSLELQKVKVGQDGGENISGDQPSEESVNNPGRPPNKIETNPRDTRTPRTLSIYKAIGEKFLVNIDSIIDPLFLKDNNVKNLRSLTKSQKELLQKIKFNILACLTYKDNISKNYIIKVLNKDNKDKIKNFYHILNKLSSEYIKLTNNIVNYAEKRSLAVSVWSLMSLS